MVLLGNYGIYELSKLPVYGVPDELADVAKQFFTGVKFTFHKVVKSIYFSDFKVDEQNRMWFHIWLCGTNPPEVESPSSKIGQISFVYEEGSGISLRYLQP